MVESGWLGVECEPNNIFIVCNQFPIPGFRVHDARKGTSDAQLATFSYGKAWQEKGGFLNEFNLIMANYLVRQDLKTASQGLDFDAWTGSAINAWAPEMARAMFEKQAGKYFRQTPDGRVTIYPRTVLAEVAERRAQGDPNPDIKDLSFPVSSPSIGFAAAWMTEMGDRERLEGLLAHAEAFMNPTWDDGGLYYPRNDASWDKNGEQIFMDPFSGNAMLAYARLTPPDGLNRLYNNPWDQRHHRLPALVNDPAGVNIAQAVYRADARQLALHMTPVGEGPTRTVLRVGRSASGS